MTITRTGDWKEAQRILGSSAQRLRNAVDRAVLQEAQFFRTKVVEGIREQAPGGKPFAPLAPTTLAIRRFRGFGGTKALLVHGDLRNSIVVVRKPEGVFVGVLRTAKSREGQPLVNVAAIHEHGSRPIVVRLTTKARRFLHAAFRKAGLDRPGGGGTSTGIAVIKVPARPFLAPVFEKHGADADAVARRFLGRVARLLGGDFGRVSGGSR